MNSATGSIPPLHRRFNKKKALQFIRNRYVGLKGDISTQVVILQQDAGILKKFQGYYEKGYKDWVILSAIFNCMLNWKAKEKGLLLRPPPNREEAQKEKTELERLETELSAIEGKLRSLT